MNCNARSGINGFPQLPQEQPMATDAIPSKTTADLQLPSNCSFDPDDWLKLAEHWYPVALSREVSFRPVAATLLDAPLVVYRFAVDPARETMEEVPGRYQVVALRCGERLRHRRRPDSLVSALPLPMHPHRAKATKTMSATIGTSKFS